MDSASTLVLVFAAADYHDDPAPLADVVAAYPNSVVVGCSDAGEVSGDRVLDDSIVVAVCAFDSTEIRRADAAVASPSESRDAGAALATQLSRPDLVAVLVLSEGLVINDRSWSEG